MRQTHKTVPPGLSKRKKQEQGRDLVRVRRWEEQQWSKIVLLCTSKCGLMFHRDIIYTEDPPLPFTQQNDYVVLCVLAFCFFSDDMMPFTP